jgi:hypothetical protein
LINFNSQNTVHAYPKFPSFSRLLQTLAAITCAKPMPTAPTQVARIVSRKRIITNLAGFDELKKLLVIVMHRALSILIVSAGVNSVC